MDVPSNLVTKGLEQLDISSSATSDGVKTYKLPDWKLQSGETLPNAHIAYKTFGDPKSPAIIYPSWYSGCEFANYLFPSISSLTQPNQPSQTTNGSSDKTTPSNPQNTT
jgi:homoserine acetyltransferase